MSDSPVIRDGNQRNGQRPGLPQRVNEEMLSTTRMYSFTEAEFGDLPNAHSIRYFFTAYLDCGHPLSPNAQDELPKRSRQRQIQLTLSDC